MEEQWEFCQSFWQMLGLPGNVLPGFQTDLDKKKQHQHGYKEQSINQNWKCSWEPCHCEYLSPQNSPQMSLKYYILD